MNKKLYLIAIITCISQIIYAQNNEIGSQVILQSNEFDISGLTNDKALMNKVDLENDLEFDTYAKLIEYLEEIKQKMTNQRVFKSISYTLELISDDDDNIKKYKAKWEIVDSWTLIAIPYPKFDSNTGFRIGLQVFYDNAFGTMTNWFLGLNYDFGNNTYRIQQKFSSIKIGFLSFSASVSQSHHVERKIDKKNKVIAHWNYKKTSFGIGTSINIYDMLSYGLSPSFNFRYDYRDIAGLGGFKENRFDFSINHGLYYGNVDWIENFRDGFRISLTNTLSAVDREEKLGISSSIGLSGSYYKEWKIINSYSAVGIDFSFDDPILGYGRNIRGVVNDVMFGDWGAYINTSLGIQFWRWEGVWDMQAHPFIDLGITGNYKEAVDFGKNLKLGVGVDFVLYLDAVKNLVARGTIGFDLTSGRPLLESHEIIITSSLHY